MRKISFRAHILPHLVAILVFLVVTIIFFSPIFFSGRSLDQHDINQWKGGAQEIIENRETSAEEPLWTNSMFSGMPAYLVDVKWSDSLLTNFKIAVSLGLPHPVRNVFLAMVSFYILLLVFRVRPYLAIGGALAFGLSSYLIIGLAAGHNARIGAIAFMPLVLAGIHLAFTRNLWLGGALTALAVALQLRDNHLQITYYLLFFVVLYGLIQFIYYLRESKVTAFLKTAGILVLAALLAFGTFYGKFNSISEYSRYSMRGVSELQSDQDNGENESGLKKDYAFQYSYGLYEPMTLFIPNFLGGTSAHLFVQDEDSETLQALRTAPDPQLANQLARYSGAYWGPQPYSSPYYAGAVIVFLFILGIVFAEKRYVIWLVTISILGILLSYGDNLAWFNYAMFDYFPGYNKFRSVTFAIILPLLAMPLLGMIGLESLMQSKPDQKNRKKLLIAVGIPAGLCILIVLFAGMAGFTRAGEEQLPQWFLNALQDDRASLMRSDALRSLLFVLLGGALVYFGWIGKLKPFIWVAGLVILVLADSWMVDVRYFGDDNYRRKSDNSFFVATNADKEILKDKQPGYRVLNLQNPWSEARTSYFHQSLGGYHGAKIRRYQDLIDNCIDPEIQEMIQGLQSGNSDLSGYGVINMLNTKYIVFGPERDNIIPNNAINGNAWFVNSVLPVESPDEELQQTCEIDTRQSAVVDVTKFSGIRNQYQAGGSISVESYLPNHIVYKTDNPSEGFAVFSEIYYPKGWKVTIDGTEAQMIRANYVLRALEIPAGTHTITFSFEPSTYAVGNTIMLISILLLFLLFFAAIGYSVVQWRREAV